MGEPAQISSTSTYCWKKNSIQNIIINDKIHEIPAICVDRIRTKFHATGIEQVIEDFSRKGFQIADKSYSNPKNNIVENIDLIFGTDVDPLLPIAYKFFGSENSISSYIDSPIGVIFSGDLNSMIKNLPHLVSSFIYLISPLLFIPKVCIIMSLIF